MNNDITLSTPPNTEPERQYYYMKLCKEWADKEKERLGRPLHMAINTLGCQMNARDSEKITAILEEIGYVETNEKVADFVLYNTCTVRENANMKVYGRLGYMKTQKEKNKNMKIGLCGCMMQEEVVVEKIKKSYRFVDLIFGTHNIYKIAELLYHQIQSQSMIIDVWKEAKEIVEDLPSERKYSFKSGVNIMYGCNNFCSYCIVPYVRGRERSRNKKDILQEIEHLVADGVVEIMLLGQNVNSYGNNLEEEITFAQLLQEIEQIKGLRRVRFMTSHPKDLSDDLIQVMKASNKICNHLHLPLQSGSTKILEAMNRRYTKEQFLGLAEKIKKELPGIALTTDIIVGFPGETDQDIEDTIDVVQQVGFESAYTYVYSKRTGTPAASLPDQVGEEENKRHFDHLLEKVREESHRQIKKREGQVVEVLMEHVNDQDSTLITGRLSSNAIVHCVGDKSNIGQLKMVKLTESKGFYYIGEILND